MKTINIPSPFNSYWAVFLTLGCNFKCPFCIQKIPGSIASYEIISGDKWVNALNSIEGRVKRKFIFGRKAKKIAIIGGEPTLHPDFFEIINGLDSNYKITVTSNLSSRVFDDIAGFARKIKRRKKIRFHLSFHDDFINANEFIAKAKDLKKAKIEVNKIFTVCYPPDNIEKFKEFQNIFKENGFFLEKQRFNGFYNGKLYPFCGNEDEFEFKDNIKDYEKYKQACSLSKRNKIYCKMNKVLFSPNGDIYNCHCKVYNKSSDSYGNIFSQDFKTNLPQDYFLCYDYGFCNPCDFPYAEFKPC